MKNTRGFFGIGMECISKERNAGAILRTAHAFGANFAFAVKPHIDIKALYASDTSKTFNQVPFFHYDTPAHIQVPNNCEIVGVELCDDSIELPQFCHPKRAAYIFGPERGSLSPPMCDRCHYMVKIPTKFCVNVSVAAAIVIYDRISSIHTWHRRPLVSWQQRQGTMKHNHE